MNPKKRKRYWRKPDRKPKKHDPGMNFMLIEDNPPYFAHPRWYGLDRLMGRDAKGLTHALVFTAGAWNSEDK